MLVAFFLVMTPLLVAATHHTVRHHSTTRLVTLSDDPSDGPAALSVTFNDSMDSVGWMGLRIQRLPTSTLVANDPQLWYGAGLAEGRVSAARSEKHSHDSDNHDVTER